MGLIQLLAQAGSFVPAEQAELGIVDRIFTRIGAADDLTRGDSTFMVEMVETAAILNQATRKSLVILDEIGRGTATYDGLAIACATLEWLHNENGCRTLFATHYHELNEMTETFDRIKNFNVSVRELKDKVLFLRTLVEGGSAIEHVLHSRDLGGIPRADGFIESGGATEHVPHVRDLQGIPGADGLIERVGAIEHGPDARDL